NGVKFLGSHEMWCIIGSSFCVIGHVSPLLCENRASFRNIRRSLNRPLRCFLFNHTLNKPPRHCTNPRPSSTTRHSSGISNRPLTKLSTQNPAHVEYASLR